MSQEQQLVAHHTRNGMIQQHTSSRLLYSLLLGGAVALFLILLEALALWLFNPIHLAGSSISRLVVLVTFLLHMPLAIAIILIEFLICIFIARLTARPFALLTYLRAVHAMQHEYARSYIPFALPITIAKPSDAFQHVGTSLSAGLSEQQVSILDVVQQGNTNQLILGRPGSGKTTALRMYQYNVSQHPLRLILRRERIPVYVPIKNYSLFLNKQQFVAAHEDGTTSETEQETLLNFLYESDLPGMRYLRPELDRLARQGRLLLLCDGLDEVDNNYFTHAGQELTGLMGRTENRLVITCREVDYHEQPDLVQAVEDGRAVCALVHSLQPGEVSEVVERYVERQDARWQHTAGQILQVIDQSRLRYHCTNPMMLFTLLGVIDKIGVEHGRQIDTRGCLLREGVRQLIVHERQQPKWTRAAPPEEEVIHFLSEVACAARWAKNRSAIQLPVSQASSTLDFEELAGELQAWLNEHPAIGPFDEDVKLLYGWYANLPQLLQFAQSVGLIDISHAGVLSFRHELIAEYFVAEYFLACEGQQSALPLRQELIENIGYWSELVAIWAGLLDNPLVLAERFGEFGRRNPDLILPALTLSLVCVGVLWTPPQVNVQRTIIVLPKPVAEALSRIVHDKVVCEELARIFIYCAEEGGQEIYYSLLPVIMVDGIDELLILLDKTIISELLFGYLQDTIDDVAYEPQVRRVTQVLGQFGNVVVDRAAQFSEPASGRSMRLRAACINILGGTEQRNAVEPLMARLSDTDPFVVKRAVNALTRLGPELTLVSLLQALEDRIASPFTRQIHLAALTVLGRFFDRRYVRHSMTMMHYQSVLQKMAPLLTANYQTEPEVQQLAKELLVLQGRSAVIDSTQDTHDNRWEKVVEILVHYLPSQDNVVVSNVVQALQEIGPPATPRLVELLGRSSERVRARIVEILKVTHDPRALPSLLRLLDDPSPIVQQQGAQALCLYAPESIASLIGLVLSSPSEPTAERAAQVLASIGEQVALPVANILSEIVPERTRLLVQVLEHIHAPASIPALIALLQTPQLESLLAIATIRALSQCRDKQVVEPLMTVLSDSRPQVYEEAITALSQLGEIALDDLVAALDVQQETLLSQRVSRAILGIVPFPAEQLVHALAQSKGGQAQQIISIFKMQGAEAAQVLVRHLLHPDAHVRGYVQQALNDMPGAVVVPALLELLSQPAPMRKAVSTFLLKYPDAAISPLVDLLGEHERGGAAAIILPQFGTKALRSLISGLDDTRSIAWERAQSIIIALVRQSQDEQAVLREVVHLFYPPPPLRAHQRILEVLTHELADLSIPVLLEGLEDAHLMSIAAEALVHMGRTGSHSQVVLDSLLQSLFIEERHRGASDALIQIGAPAVPRVGELITDSNQSVAKSAKYILSRIGVPALPFIWAAHSDRSNPARCEAATEIFQSMPTSVIKDELVTLLKSTRPNDIAMAVALLMERIQEEATRHYAEREMIPELVEYVQTHDAEEANIRILALLLLLGERTILDHLLQTLDDFPRHRKQLTYIFLLLGKEAQRPLLEVFNDPDTTPELRAELAAVLGMMAGPDGIVEYAQNLSSYGIAPTRTKPLFPEQLAIALHALGGLLASGYWDVKKLQELHTASREGSPAHELFGVLLGWRYETQIAKLQSDLQSERDAHRQEVLALTGRIVENQGRIQALENEIEELQREHGFRSDELFHTTRQNEELNTTLGQMTQERNSLRIQLEQARRENESLREEVEQLNWRVSQSNTP